MISAVPTRRQARPQPASEPTFAHFDLDAGVALGDILDAPNDLGHLGAGGGVDGNGAIPAM